MSDNSSLDYNIPDPATWKPLLVRELEFKPIRSRGPGGQHVNRTQSAVQVLWCLSTTQIFDEAQKAILNQRLSSVLNSEGDMYLRVETERSLLFNKETAIKKVLTLVEKAFLKTKKRFKTRPTRSSVRKRVEAKSIRAETKKLRKVTRNDFE